MLAQAHDPLPAWRDRVQGSLAALGAEGVSGALGLDGKREGAAFMVRCPAHEERTPSCNVGVKDGRLVWHCFGCGEGGDGLDLVGKVRGLRFFDALEAAAELAGEHSVAHEVREHQNKPRQVRPRIVAQPPKQRPLPRTEDWKHPPDAAAFWNTCKPLTSCPEAVAYLQSREQSHGERFDVKAIEQQDLARVLPSGALPTWAKFRGQPWSETGHLIILPAWNADGMLASVRTMNVRVNDAPKRLPPVGFDAKGLTLANDPAIALLCDSAEREAIHEYEGNVSRVEAVFETQRRTVPWPTVNLAEGEPDFLLDALLAPHLPVPVLGLWSGSWTADIAARIPNAPTFVVSTDADERGYKYARDVRASFDGRIEPIRRIRKLSDD